LVINIYSIHDARSEEHQVIPFPVQVWYVSDYYTVDMGSYIIYIYFCPLLKIQMKSCHVAANCRPAHIFTQNARTHTKCYAAASPHW